jgi:hypothetical protein
MSKKKKKVLRTNATWNKKHREARPIVALVHTLTAEILANSLKISTKNYLYD